MDRAQNRKALRPIHFYVCGTFGPAFCFKNAPLPARLKLLGQGGEFEYVGKIVQEVREKSYLQSNTSFAAFTLAFASLQ